VTDPQTLDSPGRRAPTPIDEVAERWVDDLVELSPSVGLRLGRDVPPHYGDLSPDGHDERAARAARTLTALGSLRPRDQIDAVTKADLSESLAWMADAHAAHWHLRDLNVLSSPAQEIRQVIDLMPRDTPEEHAQLAVRLAAVPAAVDGYIATLREGILRGVTPARRQVVAVAAQAHRYAATDGFFAQLALSQRTATLRSEFDRGVAAAREAYARLGAFLTDELAPAATTTDAVGAELYGLALRHFLGTTVDPEETYRWGIETLAVTVAEQVAAAREWGASSVADAVVGLMKDSSFILTEDSDVRAWLQHESDAAMTALDGTAIEIPHGLRDLEARISPAMQSGAYYTAPSDNLDRPGRMWWPRRDVAGPFATWRERTTVFHEGIPGHHLQMGMAVIQRDRLNTWRRHLAGSSGHSEGWALYAERLMADMGFLDDPAYRLGMLDAQRLRAARVVIDIGVHLQLPHPDGGTWDARSATEFLRSHTSMTDQFVAFEVDRYLGWPGQAPSYKVGQRFWEDVICARRSADGSRFSLRDFHRQALGLGGVGLDTLKSAMTSRLTEPAA